MKGSIPEDGFRIDRKDDGTVDSKFRNPHPGIRNSDPFKL